MDIVLFIIFSTITHQPRTINQKMNYILYVLAAYLITFVIIAWMFGASYTKYRRVKGKLAEKNATLTATDDGQAGGAA